MKKWHLIALTIGILITLGSLLLIRNNPSKTSSQPASTQVLMKPNVFEPETLTIKKGTTVEFKNEDSQPRWPASNIHPTHTIYPEFDPLKPVEPGTSWSFTFDKVGSWKYHDHLIPSIRGEVVVTE